MTSMDKRSLHVNRCLACCSADIFSVADFRSSFIHFLEKEPGMWNECWESGLD